MRDRKGIITNFLPPISLALLILLVLGFIDPAYMPQEIEGLFAASLWINFVALFSRYFIRVSASKQVYGIYDLHGVLIRWPIGMYINAVAVFRAWKTYLGESRFATRPIVWSKTTHELPEDFMNATR
jgi:adsorption protein B